MTTAEEKELREDLDRARRALDRLRGKLAEVTAERDGLTQAAAMLRDHAVHEMCLELGPKTDCATRHSGEHINRIHACEAARRLINAPRGQLALLRVDAPAPARMAIGVRGVFLSAPEALEPDSTVPSIFDVIEVQFGREARLEAERQMIAHLRRMGQVDGK